MTKRFGGTLAVDGIDLALYPGEILALLGENGAGKSTLIKMLAGVYAPDAGHMRRNGEPYDPRKDTSIAFIHQDLGLIEWMTVAENIAMAQGYPRRLGLIDWDALERRARESLAWSPRESTPGSGCRSLSRTEKSLVAIARALAPSRRAGARRADREPAAGRGRDPVRGAALAERPRRRDDLCLAPPGRGLRDRRSPRGAARRPPGRRPGDGANRAGRSRAADHRPAARGRVRPAGAAGERGAAAL